MSKVFIIAEAGINHNGDLEIAKQLIDVAAEAKADAVKFQTFKTEKLVALHADKAEYQKNNSGSDESQFDMLKKAELDSASHMSLQEYCNQKGILFLSTAFDIESAHELNNLNLPIFKIPSGELTNLPLVRTIASFGKEIILSTGMANMSEIKNTHSELVKKGVSPEKITILHCNTDYPTQVEDVNLKAMQTIEEKLGSNVGYSDHTLGIEVPIAAVALGATVIEKHFTLDRSMEGPDHAASLLPEELKQMVHSIRNIEKALGSSEKRVTESEQKNVKVARKSIFYNENVESGTKIKETDLTTKRPGDGVSPMKWDNFVGKKLNTSVKRGDYLKEEHFS